MATAPRPRNTNGASRAPRWLAATMAALGVVYGDIGTSPLYAVRECFHSREAVALTPANVLGVLSLILWALILVISIKYLWFVMRADNDGEGGILALMVLARQNGIGRQGRWWLTILGLFGAGLLYGDGMITPAISVLSAVEGVTVASPAFTHYVAPLTLVILFALFAVQARGTARVGRLFGPVMLVWFVTLAVMGVVAIIQRPEVLAALSPHHGLSFLLRNRLHGFIILGIVFLVVTGGEALYADMGHFGAQPIRRAWFALVLPTLLLNYFGQGALLLRNPAAAENPFYHLAPDWLRYPLILLATAATVIASQAVITGAFSLANQAVQLGFSPRLRVVHTSSEERGQIYLPGINWWLFIAVAVLVLTFHTSSGLAGAYGMAVTSTMVITTILLYVVARKRWGWPRLATAALAAVFLLVDLSFFGANVVKILAGGWLPLTVGVLFCVATLTWKRGRELLAAQLTERAVPTETLLQRLEEDPPPRVEGAALFLTAHPEALPSALLYNLRHNKVLHERVGILTIVTEREPRVPLSRRVDLQSLGSGLYRIIAHYGFMERPRLGEVLEECRDRGVDFTGDDATYFLGRETLEITAARTMPRWQKVLFLWLSRNAMDASAHFGLPPDQIVEIGVHIGI